MANCYTCIFNLKTTLGFTCSIAADRLKPYCKAHKSIYSSKKQLKEVSK